MGFGHQNARLEIVLPHFRREIDGDLPVEHFSWDYKQRIGKTGSELVMDYYKAIDSRALVQADKVLMVLRNVFNHAIDKG